MQKNIEKYREDLKKLISKGDLLHISMQYKYYPEEVKKNLGENNKNPTQFL